MGVEEFGVNIYILQLIFGAVDIPAKFITILSISYLGRRITQGFLLLLAGGAILALIFVSPGERLRLPSDPLEEAATGWKVNSNFVSPPPIHRVGLKQIPTFCGAQVSLLGSNPTGPHDKA